MGLKKEQTVSPEERFNHVEDLVKYYKQNCIHLQNGAKQVTLKSAHPMCEARLR